MRLERGGGHLGATRQFLYLVVSLLVLTGVLVLYLYPSYSARQFFDQWKIAVESGDWDTAWSLIGPGSSMTEDWRLCTEEKSDFIKRRELSHPGTIRRVGQPIFHRDPDDPATFSVNANITYVDPQSGKSLDTRHIRFHVTQYKTKFTVWCIEPSDW